MNVIDRAIEMVSPKWAAKRVHDRAKLAILREVANSGYSHHGASRTKTSTISWFSSSKSPAEDITENHELLRERSRDLYYGGGSIGRGAIERVTLNAVGPGLSLNCRIDADFLGMGDDEAQAWEDHVEREFGLWAESKECDVSRMQNFYELQNLCFRSVLVNGDALALMPFRHVGHFPYDLRVALIESDLLGTPFGAHGGKVIDGGVELNADNAPVAYHIANRHPLAELPGQPKLEYKRIPAFGEKSGRRNVLHLMPFERIGQHRGVPFLAPVVESLKQLGRYTDAELMAAVIGGMYAIFFEHDKDEAEEGEEQYATDEDVGMPPGIPEGTNLMSMGYGAMMDLPAGVKPSTIAPNRPNQAFDPFVLSLCRQIGSCLGVPVELLFLHFTSSYSASRGALLEAWKLFSYWRNWWATNFCQPIYVEWLHEAILKGRVSAPGFFDDPMIAYAYSWAEWNGPTQGQLDPLKEVNAAAARVANGFSTRQRETMELTGGDWMLNHRQRVKEERMRREDGLLSETKNTATEGGEAIALGDNREE